MINVPLRMLIRSAYQVQDDQIVDAPDWISAEHFDVLAKAGDNLPPPTPGMPGAIQLMMRSLLSERFRLAVHRETREFPAYTPQLDRRDARLGPQLRRSTVDCVAMAAARGRSGGAPPAPPADRPQCGIRAAGGQMIAGGLPLSELAVVLSRIVQRVVIDQTGLTGTFDLDLNWTPDRTAPNAPAGVPAAADPDAPSIFTALKEQLGLKLEAAKRPVEVLVIDHVERPAPN
jgi:uncharacterized protein (TIGR03435 family)